MGPGRGSWFWGCFAGAGRALNAAAIGIWISNAFFASWLYITRLAPWVFGAVPSPPAAHFSLWALYFLAWIFWMLAWWHDPGRVTGARARSNTAMDSDIRTAARDGNSDLCHAAQGAPPEKRTRSRSLPSLRATPKRRARRSSTKSAEPAMSCLGAWLWEDRTVACMLSPQLCSLQ